MYFAFGTLAVLALWFFIFVAFFPAEWIVPFFTVACIVIPICVYMMVLRSGSKERAKAPSKRSFEIPKKDITVESAKTASAVSSEATSAPSATTPSKTAASISGTPQQTAPVSSTPSSATTTDASAAPAAQPAAPAANADGLSNEDALLLDFLIGKTLNDDVANADDTFALPKGTEITREIALDAKKHDALLLLTMSVD